MSDHAELKHLQRRQEEAKANLRVLTDESNTLKDKIRREQATINKCMQQIGSIKKATQGLVVSEHAIVRYFERVLKYNLDEIKKQIVPDKVQEAILTLGSGQFPADTHRLRVKDRVVVTLLTDNDDE